ncbi:MAG: hypothetical protein RIS47_725 [Bacteroidota bacterium]|jgi:DNA-binding response OmpR family regulator
MSNQPTSILVADDVFTNIEFLRYILRKEKYNIIPVTNGSEALQAVKENAIDLILLDVMMPEVDGFEVCRQLKEDPNTADIPVIFLTARTDIESTVKGFELGAVDYVTKPFHRQELLARVKTHIDLKRSKSSMTSSTAMYDEKLSTTAKLAQQLLDSLQNGGNLSNSQALAQQIIDITKA